MTRAGCGSRVHGSVMYNAYGKALPCITDPVLRDLLREVGDSYFGAIRTTKKTNIDAFIDVCRGFSLKALCCVDWSTFCRLSVDFAHGMFCAKLLCLMLDRNLYEGDYKEELLKLRDCFDISGNERNDYFGSLFCGNAVRYLYHSGSDKARRYYIVATDNPFVRGLIESFIDTVHGNDCVAAYYLFSNFDRFAGHSLAKVSSLEDFNYEIFSGIVRAVIAADKENAASRLIVLRKFFRYLDLKLEPEGKFIFGESSPFTRSMLIRKDLHGLFIDGFTPVCYAPYADVPSSDRWILDLSGFEGTSTRLRAGKSYIVDFSGIRSGYYTHLAKVFIWRLKDANIMTRLGKMLMLVEMLNKMSELSENEKYLSLAVLSRYRMWVANLSGIVDSTRNSYLAVLRAFISYFVIENKIVVERGYEDFLKAFKTAPSPEPEVISEERIDAVNKVMIAKCEADDSFKNIYCYAIFFLLLQTEFRVSQICNLKRDCITGLVSERLSGLNAGAVATSHKTSHGDVDTKVITAGVRKLLETVQERSLEIAESSGEFRNYMFVYRSEDIYRVVDANVFSSYLRSCCREAGVEPFNATDMRKFHMTKAYELKLLKNWSDIEVNLLSGHADINTTLRHYVQVQTLEIISLLNKVVIGERDVEHCVKGEVVKDLPAGIDEHKQRVNGGCGWCRQHTCNEDSMISCFLCRSFVTTVDKETAIKNLMVYYDGLIDDAKWEHDREDLQNKKKMLACYLAVIAEVKAEVVS